MVLEISPEFRFGDMLSHTFPGLFTALTLFMITDYFSPFDLTKLMTRDFSSVAAFAGGVFLLGTTAGVLIDGIHHSIIEKIFFKNLPELKKIEEAIDALYPADDPDPMMRHSYFNNKIGNNAMAEFDYLKTSIYKYSEFDANTFIALVPFSFIIPFYFVDELHIPWKYSLSIGLASLIIAFYCLNNSYNALKEYHAQKFSLICGHLKYNKYIHISNDRKSFQLVVTIIDKDTRIRVQTPNIQIFFKAKTEILINKEVYLGLNGTSIFREQTNQKGEAIIRYDRSRFGLVTVTSKNCIPGVIYIGE